MPLLLTQLLRALRGRLRGWRKALAVIGFVFLTSWLMMSLAEGGDGELARPENYWWWFLITAATVGYGDLYPVEGAARLVGAYVVVAGIVTLTMLFTELTDHLQNLRGKRMKGVLPQQAEGHVVVLGYRAGRTERIVHDLRLEEDREVVLCAWEEDAPEHPMPEEDGVGFVRGDLSCVDVLARAGVARAGAVIVDARDDNEALALALAVRHTAPRVHLVAALRDMARRAHLRYVDPEIQCVQWHLPNLLTEEALDPGVTEVYTELTSSSGSSNTYSLPLPAALAGRSFGECQTWFGREFGATVIAVRQGGAATVNPSWGTVLAGDAVLYYLAAARVDPRHPAPTLD
ncbi:NAD-binding protein [Streptomyces durbertensis]|uniref:NAD-binding protein n=1 Tax=Streptomyces durbertensis TaxID=2448886 RepID=A0ABR6ELS0_9ACTN|nr:ion channel [Streptomyces durbertensis]MBB1246277.1 NAD-binding protein [Streptomyces durbertensis]